tara:strand:+ start:1898 stop:2620 length:723 start_codon:yes stop_codon:yes gene_type:complete
LKNTFHEDLWLSDQLSKNVYRLNLDSFTKENFLFAWEDFKIKNSKKNYFIYSKIQSNRIKLWQTLEEVGFKLIDTNIEFELNKPIINNNNFVDIKIDFANDLHQKAVGKIAKQNFIFSRFHLDPLINNKIANNIKKNWAENFFLGKRGNKMVVALLNNIPVGFLQIIINKGEFLIDLIAVDKKAQGKGAASAMIIFAENNIKCNRIKVGTQIGNFPSIKLYQKLGFELIGADYVFHYHKS